MKILVDKMPKKVEDCPWAQPIDNPWGTRTIWFCDWALNNGETCPMAKGCECPYFTTMSRQNNLEYIMDAFNEVHPIRTQEVKEIIIRNPNRKES